MNYYLIVLWGFVFSFIVGLTGVGTGTIGTAGLIVLFGVNPQTAVASNIINGTLMKGAGSFHHNFNNNITRKAAVPFIIGAATAVFAGAYFSRFINGDLFKLVIGIVLIFSLILSLVKKREKAFEEKTSAVQTIVSLAGGAVIGFMVGLTSIGTGTLIVTAMFLIVGLSPRAAVGTSIFAGIFILSIGSVSHLIFSPIDYRLLTGLLAGSLPGVLAGSYLCSRIKVEKVRSLAYLLIAVGAFKMIIDYLAR